jgi:hypothetical protein
MKHYPIARSIYPMRNPNIEPLQSSACNSGLLLKSFVSILQANCSASGTSIGFLKHALSHAFLSDIFDRVCADGGRLEESSHQPPPRPRGISPPAGAQDVIARAPNFTESVWMEGRWRSHPNQPMTRSPGEQSASRRAGYHRTRTIVHTVCADGAEVEESAHHPSQRPRGSSLPAGA